MDIFILCIIAVILFINRKKFRKTEKKNSHSNFYFEEVHRSPEEQRKRLRELATPKNTPSAIIKNDIENKLSKSSSKENLSDLLGQIQNELSYSQQTSRSNKPMIPLLVPYEDKDIVKKLGATWCNERRTWFWSMEQDREIIKDWLPLIYQPDAVSPYTSPRLIPQNLWNINLRSLLPSEEWNKLRNQTYKKHAYRCTVCGCKGKDWPVECDEQWEYTLDPDTPSLGVVRFSGLNSLCPGCHKIKHFGKAHADGLSEITFARMCYFNDWEEETANKFIDEAYSLWDERSKKQWYFDFSYLKDVYGIDLSVGNVSPILNEVPGT